MLFSLLDPHGDTIGTVAPGATVSLSDPSGLRPVCGEGCTPEEEAELVRDWATAKTQAAASGTGAYDPGRIGEPAPPWGRPPGLPVRGLPFSLTLDDVTVEGTAGAYDWLATGEVSLSAADEALLLVLASDGTLRGIVLGPEEQEQVASSGVAGMQTVPLMRGGLRLQADPGSVSVGASLGAGAAGPLSVSVVRTTTGVSTRLGRPGAYLETELALSSPGGTLSGSATVRVDLAPRPPSLGDVGRVVLFVSGVLVVLLECAGSEGAVCPIPQVQSATVGS